MSTKQRGRTRRLQGYTSEHGAKVTVECTVCGKPITRYCSEIRRAALNSGRFYCSKKCQGVFLGNSAGKYALAKHREPKKPASLSVCCKAAIAKQDTAIWCSSCGQPLDIYGEPTGEEIWR